MKARGVIGTCALWLLLWMATGPCAEPGQLKFRGWLSSRKTEPLRLKVTGDIEFLQESGRQLQAGMPLLVIAIGDRFDRIEENREHQADIEDRRQDILSEREDLEDDGRSEKTRLDAGLQHALLEAEESSRAFEPGAERLLDIDIELARLNLLEASEELERQERMLAKAFVSQAMVEPFRRRVETSQAALKELMLKKELLQKGPVAELLVELEKNVERYRGRLEIFDRKLQRDKDLLLKSLKTQEFESEKIKLEIARREGDVEQAKILAEGGGVFVRRTFPDWTSGGAWTEYRAGIKKSKGDTVADIIDPSEMRVELLVNEVDIKFLRVGQKARVILEAYPDQEFSGRIGEIGASGKDRFELAPLGQENGPTGVTVFRVMLDFEVGVEVHLHPGMSAMVHIELKASDG